MTKVFFILLGIGIIVFIIFVGLINLMDESPHPQALTLADLPLSYFDADNGFYTWWGLAEPKSVDLKSEEYTTPFKENFDPTMKSEKFLDKYAGTEYIEESRKKFAKYENFIDKIKFPKNFPENCFSTMNTKWDKVEEAQQKCAVLLQRYNELLHSPIVRDFIYPCPTSNIPHLRAVIKIANLYTAICIARAVQGEWQEAAAGLISQIACMRRFLPYSRNPICAMIAKAVIYRSLKGLVSLLNHPQCSKTVFSAVLADLPPLIYEEYGNRNSFIYQVLETCIALDGFNYFRDKEKPNHPYSGDFMGKLFMQKNTTKNYHYEYCSRALKYDRQEPYLWQEDPEIELDTFVKSKTTGFLWWLKNPVGKTFFIVSASGAIGAHLFKSLRLRVTVDMIRILAELKLKYIYGKKIEDLLIQLETYKTVDPGSGKHYKWSAEKQILYSIGMDKIDNNGVEIFGKTTGTDVTMPIKIY